MAPMSLRTSKAERFSALMLMTTGATRNPLCGAIDQPHSAAIRPKRSSSSPVHRTVTNRSRPAGGTDRRPPDATTPLDGEVMEATAGAWGAVELSMAIDPDFAPIDGVSGLGCFSAGATGAGANKGGTSCFEVRTTLELPVLSESSRRALVAFSALLAIR